jgi:hypothetical protein
VEAVAATGACIGKHSPKAVVAMGGNYAIKNDREVPDAARCRGISARPWWRSASKFLGRNRQILDRAKARLANPDEDRNDGPPPKPRA